MIKRFDPDKQEIFMDDLTGQGAADQPISGVHARRVSTYRDCRAILESTSFCSSSPATQVGRPRNNLLFMDGDEHRALKAVVTMALRANVIARMEQPLAQIRDSCIDGVIRAGGGDLMADVVERMVLGALFEALELNPQERESIEPLLRKTLGSLELEETGSDGIWMHQPNQSLLQMATALDRGARAGRPTRSQLELDRAVSHAIIAPGAAAFMLPVVLHGGWENPRNGLGLLVEQMLRDPSALHHQDLVAKRIFINSVLTVGSPVRGLLRWATEDVPEFDLAEGEPMWIDIESANRQLAGAGQYGHHLSFGHGSHRCPGVGLTYMVANLLVDGLKRLPPKLLVSPNTLTERWAVTHHVTEIVVGGGHDHRPE